MKTLYSKARNFVYRNARPLDFALWQYHFENGTKEAVLNALAAYQNPDGGFGHGLEADSLNPHSSPLQTWQATVVLRQIGFFDTDHPIIAGIARYLANGEHFDGHCWSSSVPTNNDYPHAPWWTYAPPQAAESRDYNPTAALAGFLLRVTEPGTDARALAERIALEAYDYFMSHDSESDMHLLPCYLTLCGDVQRRNPSLFDCESMFGKLRAAVAECVTRDADKWDGNYCAHPSNFLIGEGIALRSCFPELAEKECDFIASTQLESGAWPITWSWGEYPDAFAVSANFWQSAFCINNLLYLKGMGRI